MFYKFKEQVYYAWRNVGTELEHEYINKIRNCVEKIGVECVPEESLLNAIMKKQDKVAVNLIDYFSDQFAKTLFACHVSLPSFFSSEYQILFFIRFGFFVEETTVIPAFL